MFYLDISSEKWIEKNPTLINLLPIKCICGLDIKNLKPYICQDYIGLEGEVCKCGRAGAKIFMPRSEKSKKIWSTFYS